MVGIIVSGESRHETIKGSKKPRHKRPADVNIELFTSMPLSGTPN